MPTSTTKNSYQITIAKQNDGLVEIEDIGSLASAYTPRDCAIERLSQLGNPQIIQGRDSFQTTAGIVTLAGNFTNDDVKVVADYIRVSNKAKGLGVRWTRIRETQHTSLAPSISRSSSRNVWFLSIIFTIFTLIALFGSGLATMVNSEVPLWLVPVLFGGTALAIIPVLGWQILRLRTDRLIRESFKKTGEPIPFWL